MLRRILRLAAALLLVGGAADAAQDCRAPVPLEHKNPVLQTQLVSALDHAGLSPALARRELAVALLDLTLPGLRFYAGINDDHMMYAASLPKLAILVAMLEGVDAGEIAWTPDTSWRLTKMITISDNDFANWGARRVGLERIAEVMRSPRYCFYVDGVGGLWMGRTFEKEAITRREPLENLSNAATARQTARFYALLDRGQLVSPYWSHWMLAHMGPPEYVHKFYKALGKRPGVRFPARKSGTWLDWHADSALIEHDGRRYVLVGLAEHPDGEEMMQRLALVADDLIARGEHRWWR